MSTELMTSTGKHTPHLAAIDPGMTIYNWGGNKRASCSYYCYRGNSHSISENYGPKNSHDMDVLGERSEFDDLVHWRGLD
jgi:hypothetical protein